MGAAASSASPPHSSSVGFHVAMLYRDKQTCIERGRFIRTPRHVKR